MGRIATDLWSRKPIILGHKYANQRYCCVTRKNNFINERKILLRDTKLVDAEVPSSDADVHQTLITMTLYVHNIVFLMSVADCCPCIFVCTHQMSHLLWEMLLHMLLILLLLFFVKHLSTDWAVQHLGTLCNPKATRRFRDVGTLRHIVS